jgi:hypothetical protein
LTSCLGVRRFGKDTALSAGCDALDGGQCKSFMSGSTEEGRTSSFVSSTAASFSVAPGEKDLDSSDRIFAFDEEMEPGSAVCGSWTAGSADDDVEDLISGRGHRGAATDSGLEAAEDSEESEGGLPHGITLSEIFVMEHQE